MHRHAPPSFREGPFAYHEEIELMIDDLTNLGSGVGRVRDWVVMVPFTIPGERVRARVFRNHDRHSDADLVAILQASPDRIPAPCPLFASCGGCQYQHIEYARQLELKRHQVITVFARIAGITDPVDPTHPSPRIYGYRSKITPHYGRFRPEGENPIGFLAQGTRQKILDVPQCPIATDGINRELPAERSRLLHPKSRKRPNRGGTLLLRDVAEGIVTDPRKVVTERVGKLVFQFPAGEFFQNNPFVLPDFAAAAVEAAASSGAACLVDAYCGSGLFSLAAADRFERVLGIEVSDASVRWAQGNAALNRITNVDFFVGDAAAIFQRVTVAGDEAAVILDPPRRGSDAAFLEQLLAFAPRRIVYVSCDPATQARDLKFVLTSGVYRIDRIQPFDLFPQTRHIETIVTLSRQTPT